MFDGKNHRLRDESLQQFKSQDFTVMNLQKFFSNLLAARWALMLAFLGNGYSGWSAPADFWRIVPSDEPGRALLRINAADRAPFRIPRDITGKFAEHLGSNISHGMDAQVLWNPTFADYPFASGRMTPDGVVEFESESAKIRQDLRQQAIRIGWPENSIEALEQARADGLACWWIREGARTDVIVSPDTGPYGNRAQRIETAVPNAGISQWTPLPLRRTREFEVELFARSPGGGTLQLELFQSDAAAALARARMEGLGPEWRRLQARLRVPDDAPADGAYRLGLIRDQPGTFVIQHLALWPADQIHRADPDVIRFLRAAKLPLLRWPGGNFASTYHWEDGVGPKQARPTRPNYAWGGVEPNWFGTDEYIAFCRAVGCEPMICVNAGAGTPEEAARWVEYCNGSADTPMGARRAANGHPEPYRVRKWELGNELWGRWQDRWTTATGYADRFRQFARAARAADPNIELFACGAPALSGRKWNVTLIHSLGPALGALTDHPLIGGIVSRSTPPLDVFRDFMAVPNVLARAWAGIGQEMAGAGAPQPRLAITELQMFAHLGREEPGAPVRLGPENLVNPGTLAEALYDILIYHDAARLQPLIPLITHSAVVNHGGGLRKERERVYANPCYYAQAAWAEFAGAQPTRVELQTPMETAPMVLPDLKKAARSVQYGALDAFAARTTNGDLLLSIVHRGAERPIRLSLQINGMKTASQAQVWRLTGPLPWAANSLDRPDAIRPELSRVQTAGGKLALEIPPYTALRLRFGSSP